MALGINEIVIGLFRANENLKVFRLDLGFLIFGEIFVRLACRFDLFFALLVVLNAADILDELYYFFDLESAFRFFEFGKRFGRYIRLFLIGKGIVSRAGRFRTEEDASGLLSGG